MSNEKTEWIKIRKSQINIYRTTPLYYLNEHKKYILYKPAGKSLTDVRLLENRYPDLFINHKDKALGIQELQKTYNKRLKKDIQAGTTEEVKQILVNIVEETLTEPRSGTLSGLKDTVDLVVSGYSEKSNILHTLASLSISDYTTAIHSVNVMALTMGYCFHAKMKEDVVKQIGLSALLHDLGKTQIPHDVLNANRRLTKEEFDIIKAHPIAGYNLLKSEGYRNEIILRGAIEHHEKLDGSGYPHGIKNVSLTGRIIGIIDCYEAITNDDRPYRSALDPLIALSIIKKDVQKGKFDLNIFEKFAYSLL